MTSIPTFGAGKDLNISAGDKAVGGAVSFGNLTNASAGGRKSDWLFGSTTDDRTPMVIGGGVLAVALLSTVFFLVRGRK